MKNVANFILLFWVFAIGVGFGAMKIAGDTKGNVDIPIPTSPAANEKGSAGSIVSTVATLSALSAKDIGAVGDVLVVLRAADRSTMKGEG